MLRLFSLFIGLICLSAFIGCSDEGSLSDGFIGILNSPEPIQTSQIILTDVLPHLLEGGYPTVDNAEISNGYLLISISHSGGCVEHTYPCYMTPSAFLESYPVQANLYIRDISEPDPCDGLVTATIAYDLASVRDLYRQNYGPFGTIALNIYDFAYGYPSLKYTVIYAP